MKTVKDIKKYLIRPNDTILKAIEILNNNKDDLALVINENGALIGTITDGDIRRFMLAGHSIDAPCRKVMGTQPVTAHAEASKDNIQALLDKYRLRSIPLVDISGYPKNIIHLRDLMPHKDTELTAVIMAGGEGKRLRPYTEKVPKPMVHVGGRPILENIIDNLKNEDIDNLFLSINYQGKVIEDYFGNGSKFGVNITYLREKEKLGTAGSLSLLPDITSDPILIINGDVVSNINFSRFFEFHRKHRSVMCVAACDYHINIPLGVIKHAEHYVLGIEEKPSHSFLCNAGIYLINSELRRFIPTNKAYNMTDLLCDVVREGLPISTFPIHEYWIDIGQKEDLIKAQEDFKTNGIKNELLEK